MRVRDRSGGCYRNVVRPCIARPDFVDSGPVLVGGPHDVAVPLGPAGEVLVASEDEVNLARVDRGERGPGTAIHHACLSSFLPTRLLIGAATNIVTTRSAARSAAVGRAPGAHDLATNPTEPLAARRLTAHRG